MAVTAVMSRTTVSPMPDNFKQLFDGVSCPVPAV
jgi:hypothetical protein